MLNEHGRIMLLISQLFLCGRLVEEEEDEEEEEISLRQGNALLPMPALIDFSHSPFPSSSSLSQTCG